MPHQTNDRDLDLQAEMLAAKTRHYLLTAMGRVSDDANSDELYRALSYALREEATINWLATAQTYAQNDVRMLYYLSMEYLPGRLMTNSITNLAANNLVQRALAKMNRSFGDIVARECEPGLGNGGLGRLASCFLDSLATLNYPARAYGLRYQYGSFEQQLYDGVQVEAPDCWLLSENPWEFRRDLRRVTVKFCGDATATKNIHGDEIYLLKNYEVVAALPYDIPIIGYNASPNFSVITLRLWSTKESPRNFLLQRYNAGQLDQAAENTTLTDVLYPSDYHEMGKRIRLKQEYLLVSASLTDILRKYLSTHDNFRSFADKVRIQINDTHPSLVIPELIHRLTKQYDLPWKTAVEITLACVGYTNHTILSEALEEWDQGLMRYLLPRQCKVLERLNQEFCSTIRTKFPNDEQRVQRMSIFGANNKVRMAHIALLSHSVNGVAALHTEILKHRVFKDFYDIFPEKFINITNGVTQRHWILHSNPNLAEFITKRIGPQWITDLDKLRDLTPFANDVESQDEFLRIKKKNKERLIEFINQHNRLRNSEGEAIGGSPVINPNALFDVQIKRVHEYKRQLMNILHVIMLYQELLENPGARKIQRVVFFAGKAAASYQTAKEIIRLICCVARKVNHDSRIDGKLKVVYVENYNVSKAEILIPATDLSEQISTAGTEASGTGNMKLAMNGALTIGTNDGANIEIHEEITDKWWPFAFGASAEQVAALKSPGQYNPRKIYEDNAKIHQALDSLCDKTFAVNEEEHHVFNNLFYKLIETHFGEPADRYFTLLDLEELYQTQKRVEELYAQPELWAEYAINNIAKTGRFSSDRSITEYCTQWGLKPCPPDPQILEKVRSLYRAQDRCRIY